MEPFKQDIFTTVLAILSCSAALFQLKELCRSDGVCEGYMEARLTFFSGLTLLLLGLIDISVVKNLRDIDIVLSFFIMRDVGDWFFRYLLPVSYSLILYGIGAFLIIFVKTKSWKRLSFSSKSQN